MVVEKIISLFLLEWLSTKVIVIFSFLNLQIHAFASDSIEGSWSVSWIVCGFFDADWIIGPQRSRGLVLIVLIEWILWNGWLFIFCESSLSHLLWFLWQKTTSKPWRCGLTCNIISIRHNLTFLWQKQFLRNSHMFYIIFLFISFQEQVPTRFSLLQHFSEHKSIIPLSQWQLWIELENYVQNYRGLLILPIGVNTNVQWFLFDVENISVMDVEFL